MKFHKMFCIDEEVLIYLKNKNASELVNRLLLEQINKDDLHHMTQKQLETELECNKLERETQAKLKEMRKNAIG